MPNDAKIGLIIGMGMVIAVAVMSAPRDGSHPVNRVLVTPAARDTYHSVPAQRAAQLHDERSGRHTVVEGDTLESLAEKYCGGRDKADQILRLNADAISDRTHLVPGTVLRMPSGDGD